MPQNEIEYLDLLDQVLKIQYSNEILSNVNKSIHVGMQRSSLTNSVSDSIDYGYSLLTTSNNFYERYMHAINTYRRIRPKTRDHSSHFTRYYFEAVLNWDLGRNHVHLTVRFGFVTQHLWLGDFGKCNRGLRARTLQLHYLKSSVTFPFS